MSIAAGAQLTAVLNPATSRACGVTLVGPYEGQKVSWNFKTPGERLRLVIRTNAHATPGRWTLRASCGQLSGAPPLLARMIVHVHGPASGHQLLAEHRNLRVKLIPAHHQSGGAPSGAIRLKSGGRGGGRYDPGDNYPTKWKIAAQDSMVDNWGMDNRECTSWVAWALWDRNGYSLPFNKQFPGNNDAGKWGAHARADGIRVDSLPAPGSVAWSDSLSQWGHVAYVTDVIGSKVRIEQYNADFTGHWSAEVVPASSFTGYIHFKDTGINPNAYVGHIVKQDNGSVTSWLVIQTANGPRRNWIPDGGTYDCLRAAGAPAPDYLSASQLDQIPDEHGVWAHCTPPSPPPPPATTAAPPPAPTTTSAPPPTTTSAPAPTTTSVTTTSSSGPTSDTTPPSVPTGLAQIDQSSTAVRVAWNASTDNVGVAGYDLYLNGSLVTSSATSSYVIGGLSCGNTYTIGVDAYDAAGNHSAQATTTGRPDACPAPSPSVSAAKGPQHNLSGCTSSACAYLTVSWANFSSGAHTVVCYGDYGGASSFYSYSVSGSSGSSNVCVFGYPGYHAWATVDGHETNHVTW